MQVGGTLEFLHVHSNEKLGGAWVRSYQYKPIRFIWNNNYFCMCNTLHICMQAVYKQYILYILRILEIAKSMWVGGGGNQNRKHNFEWPYELFHIIIIILQLKWKSSLWEKKIKQIGLCVKSSVSLLPFDFVLFFIAWFLDIICTSCTTSPNAQSLNTHTYMSCGPRLTKAWICINYYNMTGVNLVKSTGTKSCTFMLYCI